MRKLLLFFLIVTLALGAVHAPAGTDNSDEFLLMLKDLRDSLPDADSAAKASDCEKGALITSKQLFDSIYVSSIASTGGRGFLKGLAKVIPGLGQFLTVQDLMDAAQKGDKRAFADYLIEKATDKAKKIGKPAEKILDAIKPLIDKALDYLWGEMSKPETYTADYKTICNGTLSAVWSHKSGTIRVTLSGNCNDKTIQSAFFKNPDGSVSLDDWSVVIEAKAVPYGDLDSGGFKAQYIRSRLSGQCSGSSSSTSTKTGTETVLGQPLPPDDTSGGTATTPAPAPAPAPPEFTPDDAQKVKQLADSSDRIENQIQTCNGIANGALKQAQDAFDNNQGEQRFYQGIIDDENQKIAAIQADPNNFLISSGTNPDTGEMVEKKLMKSKAKKEIADHQGRIDYYKPQLAAAKKKAPALRQAVLDAQSSYKSCGDDAQSAIDDAKKLNDDINALGYNKFKIPGYEDASNKFDKANSDLGDLKKKIDKLQPPPQVSMLSPDNSDGDSGNAANTALCSADIGNAISGCEGGSGDQDCMQLLSSADTQCKADLSGSDASVCSSELQKAESACSSGATDQSQACQEEMASLGKACPSGNADGSGGKNDKNNSNGKNSSSNPGSDNSGGNNSSGSQGASGNSSSEGGQSVNVASQSVSVCTCKPLEGNFGTDFKDVTFESSDEEIATARVNGQTNRPEITARKHGKATITATWTAIRYGTGIPDVPQPKKGIHGGGVNAVDLNQDVTYTKKFIVTAKCDMNGDWSSDAGDYSISQSCKSGNTVDLTFDGKFGPWHTSVTLGKGPASFHVTHPLTYDETSSSLPEEVRKQLTGHLLIIDGTISDDEESIKSTWTFDHPKWHKTTNDDGSVTYDIYEYAKVTKKITFTRKK